MLTERFTFHSYGATFYAARAVDTALFRILHRNETKSVTISGVGTIYIPVAERVTGPIPNRDKGTEWLRWTSAYSVTMAEFAV
jgi:hypothetical protein